MKKIMIALVTVLGFILFYKQMALAVTPPVVAPHVSVCPTHQDQPKSDNAGEINMEAAYNCGVVFPIVSAFVLLALMVITNNEESKALLLISTFIALASPLAFFVGVYILSFFISTVALPVVGIVSIAFTIVYFKR